MPLRGRAAGGKSRGTIGLVGGLLCSAGLACTTPTVAARAVWVGSVRDADGARPLFIYTSGEITESRLQPLTQGGAERLIVEVAPRGGGVYVRGVDDSWVGELGSEVGFRAAYVDLDHRRVVPLALPGELVPANIASFTAAGDALVWGEACPPAIAVVPLRAAVAPEIDAVSGGATPLRSGGKAARAGCQVTNTPAIASAADAPVVVRVDASVETGRSTARAGGLLEALVYPRLAGEAGLVSRGMITLPKGHRPVPLIGLRCAGGDPNCGVALVDPDGAGVSVAVRDGACRLLRWDVGAEEVACVITAAEAGPELDTDRLVAAISAEHYVFYDGLALHRYAWTSGELDSRPLVGQGGTPQTTADGRAVVLVRASGPLLRVDAASLDVVNVEQRGCSGAQAPVISPSGLHAAWTCNTGDDPPGEDGTADELEFAEVVRVTPGGMERYQGVPMWALAIDDNGDVLLHSRSVRRQNEAEVGEEVTRARNLYVLAADSELARVDTLEPDPAATLGLIAGATRRVVAQPL